MGRQTQNTTAAEVVLAYESMVSLGDSGDLGTEAARMRQTYQHRTGAFGPEDSWFENRVRAFWDDALTSQGFARLAAEALKTDAARRFADCLQHTHRGFFVVEDIDDEKGALLVDAWSGAELFVVPVDETQVLTLEHAEGAMDARVTRSPAGGMDLFLLPGAYHHPADAVEPAMDVLAAARARGMSTGDTLDALMRMELVLRSSSRVKAGFAYRVETLDQPASGLIGATR
jgi:hypothetical protein